jgi:hypothetical protein
MNIVSDITENLFLFDLCFQAYLLLYMQFVKKFRAVLSRYGAGSASFLVTTMMFQPQSAVACLTLRGDVAGTRTRGPMAQSLSCSPGS